MDTQSKTKRRVNEKGINIENSEADHWTMTSEKGQVEL